MTAVTKTTAKTIAEKLGLSIATVDRALNNRGNVKKETYQRIMDMVEELGYKPNKLASVLSRKMKYKIAIVYPSFAQYFWDQVEVGLNKAIHELSDYGAEFTTLRMNEGQESANVLLQRIIDSNEYQAIAIAAGEEPLTEVINAGVAKGITICTFNQDSLQSDRLFYVGVDYLQAGQLAAELTCKFVGRSGRIAVVGKNEDYQTMTKNVGFLEAAKEYSSITCTGPYSINEFKSLIQRNGHVELDGIYVSTSDIFEVAHELKEAAHDMTIVCHDLNEEIYEYLNSNVITATITQEPLNQGYLALTQLFGHLAFGEDTREHQIIKLEVVMKENAKYYL
ncbi:LacI family DNA-binding transcriptional regulator [Alkalicoccobacillus plakortidis]|uniref:LacI family DNA-binding transcriptional regulator n=1 Tax=Alkalicoccobacillus plakortidis TaxID=444060 RepID=A0ABT0XMU6_9BACI|nr:LacI family DNA-binding transcriptional regulator [Alkalicoccobacillus plakortidis]MCM2677224.1 LacI family DNA-binding transcriptional regulator [Alkalicoccobacillus plakortidis]